MPLGIWAMISSDAWYRRARRAKYTIIAAKPLSTKPVTQSMVKIAQFCPFV
jgi:hypothetical protein